VIADRERLRALDLGVRDEATRYGRFVSVDLQSDGLVSVDHVGMLGSSESSREGCQTLRSHRRDVQTM